VLETKGFDPLEGVKAQAARRWTDALDADGRFGRWAFAIVHKPEEIRPLLDRV
jgi:type III restriction enzyme